MHNSLRGLLVFGALYCATQGALDSWDEAYELPYLSYNCVTVANIAVAQTLGVLPMILKGALCVPSDVLRLRRPFVAAGLLLSGAVFFVQSSFNPLSGFAFYVLCLILRNTGAAISDGAADGLTIDAGIDELSGTLSAWQGVGRMAGLIVSTAVGAQIAQRTFAGLLMFLGAWMLASAPVAALVKEELEPSPLGRRAVAWCVWVADGLTGGRYSRASAAAASEERVEKAAAGAEGAAEVAAPPTPSPPLQPEAGEADAESAFVTNPLRASASPVLLPLLPPPQPPPAAADAALEAAPPASAAAQPPNPSAPAEQLSVYMAGVTLLRHLRRTPVAAFVAFMFLGQFATYISSFPVVLWLQERKGFSLEEVGTLTVIGAFGNMLGCYVGGVGFDTVPSKRLALAAATVLSTFPYLLFLAAPAGVATTVPVGNATETTCQGAEAAGGATTSYALTLGEKSTIIFIWVLCSIGYGALYTVQTGQMRLLADNSVAAMYSGLCMGMLAVAAAIGTYVGGALAEGGAGGYDYEACYTGGVYASLSALVVIPWITAADPEVEALKAAQREEAAAQGGGKLRRRKSFVEWVGALRGQGALEAIAAEGKAAEAAAGGGGEEWAQMASPAPRPLLRRPALGSMGNLLSAQEGEEGSLWSRLKGRLRGLFEPPEQRTRSRSRRRIQAQEWGSSRGGAGVGAGDESPASPGGMF